jgi:hypothetical protein
MFRPEPEEDVHQPADGVEAEIARLRAMDITELRSLWKTTSGRPAPAAFSKDLLARAISYRLQEDAYGGLKAPALRQLRAMAKPGAETPRQVKVGSVIMREHKGVVHEVIVVPGGFCWRGQTFESLSTIAKRITGVNWNGPRFFGLRSKKDRPPPGAAQADGKGIPAAPLASKGSSVSGHQQPRRSGRRSSIGTGVVR